MPLPSDSARAFLRMALTERSHAELRSLPRASSAPALRWAVPWCNLITGERGERIYKIARLRGTVVTFWLIESDR